MVIRTKGCGAFAVSSSTSSLVFEYAGRNMLQLIFGKH